MNNLTDRQKAAIYDDAVEELRQRIEISDKDTQSPENDEWEKGYYAGLFNGYKVGQTLLTSEPSINYAKYGIVTFAKTIAYAAVASVVGGGIIIAGGAILIKILRYINA